MKIGYARVSTDEQTLALQLDALEAEGCTAPVFRDTASGANPSRPGLKAAIDACAAGDVLTVWKLDRLGRSVFDLVALVEKLKQRDVGLKVLTGAGASIDTTRPEGRMIFAVFAALAEFERELNRERTTAGMKAARRRGKHVGRPHKLAAEQLDVAAQLLASGRSWRVVSASLKVSPNTLRESLKRRMTEIKSRRVRLDPAQIDLEIYLQEDRRGSC